MSRMPDRGRLRRTALACAVILMAASPATADSRSLADMSLEEFLNTEITSVSRKAQRLVEAPSAVFVITSEDIRRSGHTLVPELLRMVPGVHVAREDSNTWSISSRGFNSRFANKLLVLIDGRSVYTPLFSGVYWDIQDVMLEDIERIEVIRGPGATVWGANAVNGVINIITRTAVESQGNLVSVAAGNEDRLITAYRYGGKISDQLGFRISGKLANRDDSVVRGIGGDSEDEWRLGRTSMRLDYQRNARDSFTLSSDLYKGDVGSRVRVDSALSRATAFLGISIQNDNARVRGGDVILRWNRQISEAASTELQVSYDVRNRDYVHLDERRRQLDLSFTNQLALGNHDLIWGMGWRLDRDRIVNTPNVGFDGHGRQVLYSAFLQDEFDLIPDTLRLTAGSKLEWNSFTGWEVQPSVRLLATPTEGQQLWTSVSRAVRTPSRADHGLTAFLLTVVPAGFLGCPAGPVACPVDVLGNKDFESEELWSYEIGYRAQPAPNLSLDVAAYWNEYENLNTFIPDPVIPLNFRFDNGEEARGWGVEVAAQWQVADWWRLSAGYTGANLRTNEGKAGGRTLPHHKASLRSSIDLPGHVELDTAAYYVGHVDLGQNLITLARTEVDSYVRFDARIAWWPRPDLELSLVGQNLFESEQIEWIDTTASLPTQEIERAFYAKLTWRF